MISKRIRFLQTSVPVYGRPCQPCVVDIVAAVGVNVAACVPLAKKNEKSTVSYPNKNE
jgi:hypothetical protein